MYAFYFTFILFASTLISCFICCTHIAAAHCSVCVCAIVRGGGGGGSSDRRQIHEFFFFVSNSSPHGTSVRSAYTQETILAVLKAIESLLGFGIFLLSSFFFGVGGIGCSTQAASLYALHC